MSIHARQSFLGENSEAALKSAMIGIIGLGGGGSHVNQQLSHVGIGNFVLVDDDIIEESNLNRLIGGTLEDVQLKRKKVDIAKRLIHGIRPDTNVILVPDKWQNAIEQLQACNILIGAVDCLDERYQLEKFSRRNDIPYIDIGMGVLELPSKDFLIHGQVVLSSKGKPCLWCCNMITNEKLKDEHKKRGYGDIGPQPQVVWPNGVLASTAIGLVIQLLTPWHSKPRQFAWYEYDGNQGTVIDKTAAILNPICSHYNY